VKLGIQLALLSAVALQGPTTIRYPAQDLGVATLAARAKAQRDTVSQFKVFYQFQFHDRLVESGITSSTMSSTMPRGTQTGALRSRHRHRCRRCRR